MAVFNRQAASAKRMIAKYGQVCQWIKPASSEDEPDSPWNNGAGEPTVYPGLKIAFFPNAKHSLARANGGDVQVGASIAYMASVNFKPSLEDKILKADGSPVTIVNIDEINPNGESILFIIECNE